MSSTAHLSLLSVALVSLGTAHAAPFSYQGTTRAITPATDVAGEYDLVCGVHAVRLTAQTQLRTPAGPITLAQLTDPTRFPFSGRSPISGALRDGFVGGVCVADGDDAIRPGTSVATLLEVEIEESTVVGVTTQSPEANLPLAINGVAVVRLTDPRMSIVRPAAGFWTANGLPGTTTAGVAITDSVLDDFGFGIGFSETTLPPLGSPAAADGYYAVGNATATDPATGATVVTGPLKRFYAYNIQVSGGTLTRPQPRPSIQRAQCRNLDTRARDSIAVSGACVLPTNQTTTPVTLANVDTAGTVVQTYGSVACTYLVPEPGQPVPAGYRIGTYRFDNGGLTLAGNACPARIRAATTQAGVTRYDFFAPDAR